VPWNFPDGVNPAIPKNFRNRHRIHVSDTGRFFSAFTPSSAGYTHRVPSFRFRSAVLVLYACKTDSSLGAIFNGSTRSLPPLGEFIFPLLYVLRTVRFFPLKSMSSQGNAQTSPMRSPARVVLRS
jgi:hypothetical protein